MLEIKENVPLGKQSTFQVGGAAAFAVSVTTQDELREALAWAHARAMPFRVLGGASNLLVPDEGYPGLIIWMRDKTIVIDGGIVTAAAGAITAQVAGETVRAGLTGFEWAVGVPGTIGGAIYGNAGASGGEMKDVVVSVDVLDGVAIKKVPSSDCGFAYRHSAFKNSGIIILGATLQLQHADDPQAPVRAMQQVLRYRAETQPKGFASTGCIFKNYEPRENELADLLARGVPADFLAARRIPAGWLIEHAGLKGLAHGKARVSDVHGNFILNDGAASASDIAALIEDIRARVAVKFGVQLTEEITILKTV